MNVVRHWRWVAAVLFFVLTQPGRAQWLTQVNSLKPGWNGVFLHVDASHATLDEMVGSDSANPIQEIWYWKPSLPGGQFINSPLEPANSFNQWAQWTRLTGPTSALKRLAGNGAYLVKVGGTANYDWRVKGRPVIPTFRWTLSGLNFIGFPTPTSPAPDFESFLSRAPELQQTAEIYGYQGGELGATNPVRLLAFRSIPVRRDQAFWIRAGETYNRYFGPFQIVQTGVSGIQFGQTRGQSSFRLRNLVATPVTVTVRQVASEAAPAGQPVVAGTPTLLLRGPINSTNLTYSFANLANGPQQWTLAPAGTVGSEVEVVVGVNRFAMAGNPGAVYSGVLRFSDSFGLSQIDMGVSAEKSSAAGLWVGGAMAEYVSQYLKVFARATNDEDFNGVLARLQLVEGVNGYHYELDRQSGRVLVFGGPEKKTGSYLLDGPIKVDSGAVARPYPLRLIVHNDGTTSRLLQKVYHGTGLGSNTVLTTQERFLLPAQLAQARRISAVHLPVSDGNVPWDFTGAMQQGGSLTVKVPLGYDDHASNPFLHTYHPDHDNLDAQFARRLDRGYESYDVERQITLSFRTPAGDFNSLTGGGEDMAGSYAETLTIRGRESQTRTFNVLGSFSLKRISDIPALSTK